MPKKLYAVTNVKIDPTPEGWFAAGSEVDVTKFTKEQLAELHAAGAVEIRVVEEESAPTDETVLTPPEATTEPTEATGTTDENPPGDQEPLE